MKRYRCIFLVAILFALSTQEVEAAKHSPPIHYPLTSNGSLVSWDQARELLPRGATFTVIDKDSGFHFRVQRRAGSSHADVQPISHNDTAILKHLYNGKWSWKRRAIVIPVNGRLIAASMHGMPHGQGSLSNGFPGHFCIHFHGSRTHRKENLDPSHQFMILKAAGRLDNYAANASAKQITVMFLTGLKQNDKDIVNSTLSSNLKNSETIAVYLKDSEALHYKVTEKESRYPPFVKTNITAQVKMHRHNKDILKTTLHFTLKRDDLTSGWKITKLTDTD
ncbi:hypothetical protein ACFQPF_04565 [Fictibacillus iocasae]|uniref:Uncharacterized protein n=1 Tax=Fictibacillus iocasae TaxID=2715437 RepID=A0ABW2NMU8_9BACL